MFNVNKNRYIRGFTLIELLAVIAIVGILAAILIPTMGAIRQNSLSTKCVSNLRQLGVANQLYASENNGQFPPANYRILFPYLEIEDYSGVLWCPADSRVEQWEALGDDATGTRTSYSHNSHLIGFPATTNRWGSQCWTRAKILPFEVENPADKIMYLDAHNYYCSPDNKNADFRHSDKLNILYIDGHVASFEGDAQELYESSNWTAK